MFASRSLLFCIVIAALCTSCGRANKKPKQSKAPASNYAFGEVVKFGLGGRSDTFKRTGWGDTEQELTWTNAQSARVVIAAPDSASPLRLRMRLAGFTNPPWLPFQPVEVYVNEDKVADWQVAEQGDYVAIIPTETANHVRQVIELRMPQANSPKVLGIGEDRRMLGVCCYELELTEANGAAPAASPPWGDPLKKLGRDYTLGTVLNFGAGGGAQPYKISGWYVPEKDFTWMGKDPAVLDLVLAPAMQQPLTLKMKLAGMTKPGMVEAQLTEVYVNGAKIAEWHVGLPDEFEAVIPANVVAQRSRLRIELRTPNAVSSKQVNARFEKSERDERKDRTEDEERPQLFGVRCEAMMIVDAKTPASTATPAVPANPAAKN